MNSLMGLLMRRGMSDHGEVEMQGVKCSSVEEVCEYIDRPTFHDVLRNYKLRKVALWRRILVTALGWALLKSQR